MNQGCAEHKLAGIDSAYSTFDFQVPIGFYWDTVEDGHERPDGEPDDGAGLEAVY